MLITQISSSDQWHEAEKGKINCHQQKHLPQCSTNFTAYSLHDISLLYINHHAIGTKISRLQKKKLKINDIKWLAQSHTTRKQLSLQVLNPITFQGKHIILPPICSLLPSPNTPSLNIWPSSTHSKEIPLHFYALIFKAFGFSIDFLFTFLIPNLLWPSRWNSHNYCLSLLL